MEPNNPPRFVQGLRSSFLTSTEQSEYATLASSIFSYVLTSEVLTRLKTQLLLMSESLSSLQPYNSSGSILSIGKCISHGPLCILSFLKSRQSPVSAAHRACIINKQNSHVDRCLCEALVMAHNKCAPLSSLAKMVLMTVHDHRTLHLLRPLHAATP